jgi:hypothetical protein
MAVNSLISKETPSTSAVLRRKQDRQKSSKVVRKSSKVVKIAVNPLKFHLKRSVGISRHVPQNTVSGSRCENKP